LSVLPENPGVREAIFLARFSLSTAVVIPAKWTL